MLARASASGSLGCQVRCGSAAAKYTACSPVPLAISSTVPRAGSTRRSTARIGSRLRATAGELWAGTYELGMTAPIVSEPAQIGKRAPQQPQAERGQHQLEHQAETLLGRAVQRDLADPVAGGTGHDHRRHQRHEAADRKA